MTTSPRFVFVCSKLSLKAVLTHLTIR